MLFKCHDDITREVFIEEITYRYENSTEIFSSILKPRTTKKEIIEILSQPCNHKTCKKQLIYDIRGSPYDLRNCAICGCFLGNI